MKVNNNTCGYTNMYLDDWKCSMKGKTKVVIVKLLANTTVIGLDIVD